MVDDRGDVAQCPISLEPLDDPVLLADGKVYERSAILTWLGQHNTSPCTNLALPHKTVLKLDPFRKAFDVLLSENFSFCRNSVSTVRFELI